MDGKTVVYLGPTIEGVIQAGTAFRGGFPPKVDEMIKRKPFFADLMAPVERLAKMRKAVRDPESGLGALYRKAERGGK